MADQANTDRQQAVEQLYVQNFGYIRELIYSDPHMSAAAENQITEGIANHLPSYRAALTDSAFQSWAAEIVAPLVGFHAIRRLCQPFVRKAIWMALGHTTEPSRYDDYPELVQELEQDVWLWCFLNLAKLQKRGTAKITTRIYERTEWIVKDWLKRQRTRRFAVIRRAYNLPSKAKMKDAAEKLAKQFDLEALKEQRDKVESEEIQAEMKKQGLLG